jgi:hypothetical protein
VIYSVSQFIGNKIIIIIAIIIKLEYSYNIIFVGMLMSICKKTTTLIFLDLELVHHFNDGTSIGSSTTAIYFVSLRIAGFLIRDTLSDERMDL